MSPPRLGSSGATLSAGPDGQLHLIRAGETVLRGGSPTVRAWRGDVAEPIQPDVRAEPDGFLLEARQPGADGIELRWELESGRHWYGLGELIHQHWPLERAALPPTPFLTWDNGITGTGNILEPLWLTATGAGIWVPPTAPDVFSVSLNAPAVETPTSVWFPALNVTRPAHERPFPVEEVGGDGLLTVRFTGDRAQLRLLVGKTLREAQQHFVARAGRPAAAPAAGHLTYPIWTTWARFKTDINEARALAFVDEIRAARFPIGTLEIDDRWQVAYGDLDFDPARFPDPRGMIDRLHAQGIAVTAWVVPFIAPGAAYFAEAAHAGYLVRTPAGEPYPIAWWQGPGYLLDVSNPLALAWFYARLKRLQDETGLDGFKFDAGEACYFPPDARAHRPMTGNEYTRRYVEFAGRHFPASDVRSGWRNQRETLHFREWDKFSLWGRDNGLQSVLSQALTLGLIGYPFVLADMIGGNEYGEERADAEMMIRWTQANALLPMMQFSLAPWDFGDEVSELCRRATEKHVAFGPEFERLATESAATGHPIVRALVWAYNDDRETETIWDQFLLGDRWLVAPVVTPGARRRDIYLPAGRWRDAGTGAVHTGPTWLRTHPAPLECLPIFERL